MEVTRVFDILEKVKRDFGDRSDFLCGKEKKTGWNCFSASEFYDNAHFVAAALLQKGICKGDRVALISNNRPEWNFVDFGCQLAGAVLVPVYSTISQADLQFILNHAEVKMVFISAGDIYKKLQTFRHEWSFDVIYSFTEVEGTLLFNQFLEDGKKHFAEQKNAIEYVKQQTRPAELLSILYTSGTTGTPKGVMLSHQNLLSNLLGCQTFVPFSPEWKNLSFLPLNHIYERMFNTLMLYMGISVYYAQGIETIADNAKEIQPTIFVTVPRLLERMFEKILSKGEHLHGMKKKIFDWAVDLSLRYEPDGKNGIVYEMQRRIADKFVYCKWREALGGKIRYLASGGAALQPRLGRAFTCAGITTLQGYGLTETSPVIAVNRDGKGNNKFGTVGRVLENTRVKIADDGEVLCKGPGVMLGYYLNADATREVIDAEGWFHTGDIGEFDGKFLKLTDRKKEMFKTSSGKYIAPLMLETRLKECRFIEQCMVIGEGQKFASALIVPAFDYIREWCSDCGIEYSTNEQMAQHPEVKKQITAFIRQLNKELAAYEQIKRPELLSTLWTIEGGEMTPKLSMKRKVILEKYKDAVERIFSVDE